ncbi:glutathione S-transferase L3-like [Impatiens glandulifera]|uniref:glutathione S-transferase L3-like n=1 Tax=Impatiens glandulifera TaxID=253017 RepID=UPI001FB1370A|nr:glutathione S-transferase L3-like [Impatiens glandulifera]
MASRFSLCMLPFSLSAATFSHDSHYPSGNPSTLSIHHRHPYNHPFAPNRRNRLFTERVSASPPIMADDVQTILPPPLDSSSEEPALFDGTTRLYISYTCPYAQRTWITRNCKGLQEKIQLVPIDLQNRPKWYKDKVYPPNKVPALEHNNEVKGESLDLIRYIDSNFEGPSLFPDEPTKNEFAGKLLSYTDNFSRSLRSLFTTDGTSDTDAALDQIEANLLKFDDGPFFLGQFSLVDIAYAPFIERYQPFLLDVKEYDIVAGRPKLATWIEEMNKIEGYKQTRLDPKVLVDGLKKRFLAKK